MDRQLVKLSADLRRVANMFEGRDVVQILTRVGVENKGWIDDAVRADIGDTSMSGWRRGKPIQITGRFALYTGSKSGLVFMPQRRAAGPMRVLEQGRNSPTGGYVPQRSRRARRANGRTAGKGTWSEAEKRLNREVPKSMETELLNQIQKVFRG